MSDYETRDNNGSLFKNDKKTSPKHPDYKGQAMVNGEEFWLSAWIKDGRNGKFMSIAFTPKDEPQSGGNKRKPAAGIPDSEMPF